MDRRMMFVVGLAAAIAVVGGGTALATGVGVLGGGPDGGAGKLAPVLTPDRPAETTEQPEPPESQPSQPARPTVPSTTRNPADDGHTTTAPSGSRTSRSDDSPHTTVTQGRNSDD